VKGKKQIYIGEEMTHSDFDFFGDVSAPLTKWFKELGAMNFKPNEQDTIQKPSLIENSNIRNKDQIQLTQ